MSLIGNHNIVTEPSFYYMSGKQLFPPVEENNYDGFLRYLNYRILSEKENLKCHVCKILLCQNEQLRTYLFPSVVDLFLILQEVGMALRRRMLLLSRQNLTHTQFAILRKCLEKNRLSSKEEWLPVTSLFAYCFAGNTASVLADYMTDLDTPNKKEGIDDIALSYIENCQLDAAIDLYESALEREPDNEKYAKQLLELCQSCDKMQRLISFSRQLLTKTEVIPLSLQKTIS